MVTDSGKTTAPQHGLLAVLMLGVLVLSVGAAWLLKAGPARRIRAAARIVKNVRSQGLDRFWPEKSRVDWFLIKKGTAAIGWSAVARGRAGEESFTGVRVEVVQGRHHSYEKWLLNADATNGAYHASLRLADGKALETDIHLTDGVVTVLQRRTGLRSGVAARSPAPENYLPEGMLGLAVRRVADERADGQFAMVFNERPNPGGRVEFGTLRLRYVGRGRAERDRPAHRVRLSEVRGGKKRSAVYTLDEKGKILSVLGSDGHLQVAADERAVTEAFKDASQYLRRFLPKAWRGTGVSRSDATHRP